MLDRIPQARGIWMRRVKDIQPLLGGLYPSEAILCVSAQGWRDEVTHVATMRLLVRGRNRRNDGVARGIKAAGEASTFEIHADAGGL